MSLCIWLWYSLEIPRNFRRPSSVTFRLLRLILFVVGTAGHVDHGKSTLVRSLTGIDPDRLQEEKDRGMTIDLGFAWLTLPGGRDISIVDVPGHEKFVNNMLAGVGGIDLAMLVIAADESVMPQTKEHLAILDLLRVPGGLVVITKKDLVDEEWIQLVAMDVEELVQGTVLEDAPVYSVSAETGEGISELKQAMDNLLSFANPKRNVFRPRLPVDRAFTVSGFGTVVTGTLIDGSLSVGQELELTPSGRNVRIRGLQTHKKKETIAEPGTRVAANISGVDHNQVKRGEVLTLSGWLKPSEAFDVHLKILEDSPNKLRHNMFLTLHTGSSETVTRLRLLESDSAEPGTFTWAQMKPDNAIPVVKGDYFVIRSNMTTLGGGVVVDPHARRHRRRHLPTIERLAALELGSVSDVIMSTIGTAQLRPINLQELADSSGIGKPELLEELKQLVEQGIVIPTINSIENSRYFAEEAWNSLVQSVTMWLEEFHFNFPLRQGAPREELRSRLALGGTVYNQVVSMMVGKAVIKEHQSTVSRPGHYPTLKGAEETEASIYLKKISVDPFSPPTNLNTDIEIVNFLSESGKVVRVGDGIIFTSEAYDQMLKGVEDHIHTNGDITVGDVRDMFETSRKYALALMDHLDQQQITRRVGDVRILR